MQTQLAAAWLMVSERVAAYSKCKATVLVLCTAQQVENCDRQLENEDFNVASLVEELIGVLKEEEKIYRSLAEQGEKKRQVIIDADIQELDKITDIEQSAGDDLLAMSNKQISLLGDIANVLGRSDDEDKMTVTKLIGYLGSQPDIQAELTAARDNLLNAASELEKINDLNSQLLAQAMELAEFDITLFKSMRQAPETANYNKNAYNTGDILGSSGFDAKQ